MWTSELSSEVHTRAGGQLQQRHRERGARGAAWAEVAPQKRGAGGAQVASRCWPRGGGRFQATAQDVGGDTLGPALFSVPE